MTAIKDFNANDLVCAHAAVPDEGYIIGAAVNDQIKHDRVPFFITAHAINTDKNIMLFAISDQMFSTYKSQFLKQTLRSVPTTIWSSIRDFIEPEEYLKQMAEAFAQMPLRPTAQADLPSVFAANLKANHEAMVQEYNAYFEFDSMAGVMTKPNNSICRSYLIRYEGEKNGASYVVLAGMDYKGMEYYSAMSGFQMMGGLFGGMFNQQQNAGPSSDKFGHGSPCDVIEWGAENHFVAVTPKENEEEATRAFLDFVSTFHMDPQLRNRFYELKAQRTQMLYQQSLQFQQSAQQSMRNLQFQQQKLTNMLAQNSASISAGIMDSWDRKMASQSRMSQNYSEAIRGVNTYQNSYGQNVEVSVAADHVYENKYGDVYGVSGNALDNELLNKLNWKEIK